MGQREAIAFGEGVATTMRLKFEKLDRALLPGSANHNASAPSEVSDDVDLAMLVERLRNVAKPQPAMGQAMGFVQAVDTSRQAGDPDYRKAPPRVQPNDDFDLRYGLKPATFGMRPQND
jgi:hypothetical protein